MIGDPPRALSAVRGACAEVAASARQVRIVDDRIGPYAAELAAAWPQTDPDDPARQPLDESDEDRALFVLALDAVNFGSGWFPVLVKRPRLSGYHTIATCLRERAAGGGLEVVDLAAATPESCAELFGQRVDGPAGRLMARFAESWRVLGTALLGSFHRRATDFIGTAGGSAERLVALLHEHHPMYRDVATYDGKPVPLYKRAQITAADLHHAFAGQGPGRFEDLDRLTLFADNLVPHVLRLDGVLTYGDELLGRIEAGERLHPGSPEEVEIRAVAVHAGERLVEALAGLDRPTTAMDLDAALWHRGAAERYKAAPRHRCRTIWY